MTSTVRTLVALDEGVNRATVEGALPYDATFQIVGILEGLQEAWATLEETQTDVLVIACAGHSEKALLFIDNAVKQEAGRPVIVLVEGSPEGFVRRAFEAGADDIVALPAKSDEVRFAFEKALARKAGAAGPATVGSGQMVVILGPKGGTGKTLTAVNVGVALAAKGKRVVLVDLDLQFGDLGLSLGLRPERTLHDLARSGGSLDVAKLDTYLATHSSGVRVLMAPTRPDQASAINTALLRDVYTVLAATYDFIIVDTPPGFTPEVIAAIDRSTYVCAVTMLDSLSLKNTKLGLETLDLMGYDASRISLVLNRADTKVGITPTDVLAIIGREPDVLVPSDREVPRSVNDGKPITSSKPGSRPAGAFRALADFYLRAGEPSLASRNGHKPDAGRKSA
ncbi:MAG: pilus assembly protein CpaE, partial [Mycobacterium sp.]|nr:pilus assembly protein CpaE [Mycobacterium sp.]